MNEGNYCELCNEPSTEDNPVKWNYDLAALACRRCRNKFYSFAEGSEEEDDA